MEPVEDLGFEPNDEVDEVRWLTPDEAEELLSYERDRDVLAAADAAWPREERSPGAGRRATGPMA